MAQDPDPDLAPSDISRELTPHIARLRGLARSLVGSEHDAEDAVQDTLLRALERPPRMRSRLGAWLRTVLGNRVRSARLGEQRRRRRETAVARDLDAGDGTPGFDVCKQLVEAVDRLSARDRTVVTLRYFEDLPPREISRRLAIPINTVRTLLRRALSKLRVELERPGSTNTTWMGGLVAFAYPDGTAATATAATIGWDSKRGIALMQSKTQVALAGVVLVAIAVVIAWPFLGAADPLQPSGDGVGGLAAARGETTSSSVLESDGGRARASRATERDAVPPSLWEVRGVALRHDGSPAAGARLRATLSRGVRDGEDVVREGMVRADQLGAFVWRPVRPESAATLRFAGADDRWLCVERFWVLPKGNAPTTPIVVRLLELDSAIAGRVTDEDDQPIAGARVAAGEALTVTMWDGVSTTTDVDGRFRLEVPSRGGLMAMIVTEPKHVAFSARLPAPPTAQTFERDIVLRRGLRIHGVVTDTAGAPVEGAEIRSRYEGPVAARSDAAGRYELHDLDARSQSEIISARHPDYFAYGRRIQPDRADQRLDFRLQQRREVRGVVRTRSGGGIAGALVHIEEESIATGRPATVTGPDGSFVIQGVAPWNENVVVQADGHGLAAVALELDWDGDAADRDHPFLEIVMVAGRSVEGRVQDRQGRPLQGVALHGWLSARTSSGTYLGQVAHTDGDGRFVWRDLPANPVSLTFKRTGFREVERENLTLKRERLTIAMDRVSGVAGTVLDGTTGVPVKNFEIRLVPARLVPGPRRARGYARAWVYGLDFQSATGEWSTGTEDLGDGRQVGVEVSAPGYAPSPPVVVAARRDPDPRAVVVRLWPGSTLTGQVRESRSGEPVAGARVFLFGPSDRVTGLFDSRGPEGFVRRCITDGDGAFAFDCVLGSVTLAVRHDQHTPHVEGPFVVPGGASSDQDREFVRNIELAPGASLNGRVVSIDGTAATGVRVQLAPAGVPGARVARTRTDAAGRFAFERQLPGAYTLRVAEGHVANAWYPLQRRVTLTAGRTEQVDLAQREGECRLRVAVDLPGDGATTVVLRPAGVASSRRLVRTQRGLGDVFEFHGLAAGSYRVVAARGGEEREQVVELGGSESSVTLGR